MSSCLKQFSDSYSLFFGKVLNLPHVYPKNQYMGIGIVPFFFIIILAHVVF